MNKIYVFTVDNTIYETTFITFEGTNILFSYKEGDEVKQACFNISLIESIRCIM